MDLKITSIDNGSKSQEVFPLVLDTDANFNAEVMEDLRANERLFALSLSEEYLSRLTNSLDKIRAERDNGQSDKDYSLGIIIVDVCVRFEQPLEYAPVSLYLQPSESIGIFKVLNEFNLASQDLSPNKNVKDWSDC
ncbi:hypothetical protein VINI7043_02425 [Vibrio nigripulchritudo ATCC 27043]|uniref:hypothetical protein n=1 Tax=Vibrio nigripulchritudo TaxID=28173 RepID=UPI00021C226B|nr:hypothetical protein [Vibrio nigripulchritudo]EGU60951.1 hypothetical protein VINI7043_02425 [Vibrio nigripulchritudo ATCC 27043]